MILVIILVSMVETISAKTIESKGRINWERLNLEEKKINLENRRLQFEIIKLQMEACKDVYATDTQLSSIHISKMIDGPLAYSCKVTNNIECKQLTTNNSFTAVTQYRGSYLLNI